MPDFPTLQPGQKLTRTVTETWVCEGTPTTGGGTSPSTTPAVRVVTFANPGTAQPAEAAAYQAPDLKRVLFPPAPSTSAAKGQALWNLRVDSLPVHAQSATWLATIGAGPTSTVKLRPDFTNSSFGGGIPINVVPGNQPLVPVTITGVPTESDQNQAGYPLPAVAFVEHPGDCHLIVLDKDSGVCWEFYAFKVNATGAFEAFAVAKWDTKTDASRPNGWTSADAAGLSVLAGLVRYEEVNAGAINHALRFTCTPTDHAALLPATHYAASANRSAPPMGARLRLKSTVDITKLPGTATPTAPRVQTILTALKQYGLIVADNGTTGYFTGTPDARWDDSEIGQVKSFLIGRDFEFCDAGVALVTQF